MDLGLFVADGTIRCYERSNSNPVAELRPFGVISGRGIGIGNDNHETCVRATKACCRRHQVLETNGGGILKVFWLESITQGGFVTMGPLDF